MRTVRVKCPCCAERVEATVCGEDLASVACEHACPGITETVRQRIRWRALYIGSGYLRSDWGALACEF